MLFLITVDTEFKKVRGIKVSTCLTGLFLSFLPVFTTHLYNQTLLSVFSDQKKEHSVILFQLAAYSNEWWSLDARILGSVRIRWMGSDT